MKKLLIFAVMVFSLTGCNISAPWSDKKGAPVQEYPDREWYKNEFTQQVPEPEGEVASLTIMNGFSVAHIDMTEEEGKVYIAEVKDSRAWGKNVTKDTATSYIAQNDGGYEIDLAYAEGQLAIKITKIQEM